MSLKFYCPNAGNVMNRISLSNNQSFQNLNQRDEGFLGTDILPRSCQLLLWAVNVSVSVNV